METKICIRAATYGSKGDRNYMEDIPYVAWKFSSDKKRLLFGYFAIFDGHGGIEAADFAKRNLLQNILLQSDFWSDNEEEVKNAISLAFKKTHYDMWNQLEKWPRKPFGFPSTSGTTASIAIYKNQKIYIVQLGDSGIVLGSKIAKANKWTATKLTYEHSPDVPMELKRIKSAGGKVIKKKDSARVVWKRTAPYHRNNLTRRKTVQEVPFLNIARSLGDFWSYNPKQNQFVVSYEPDITVFAVNPLEHKCLILGSDGIWNMINPQEAVDLVFSARTNVGKELDVSNPSEMIINLSANRWREKELRADNMAAVVVLLDEIKHKNTL